jgi:carbamate kinase
LSNPRSDLIIFAIGGNALVRSGEIGTFEGQYYNVQLAVNQIVEFMKRDNCRNRIILTHGNGPQVGATLVRHRLVDDYYSAMPLYVCTAETQGFIGYIIEQALQDELDRANMNKNVTSLLTGVIVEPNDTAFLNPTKPIGETFDDEMTDVLLRNVSHLYVFKKRKVGSGGTKFKLFVPSPKPIKIVNYEAIRCLVNAGFTVVACGGADFEQKLGSQYLESGSIGPKLQASISFIRNGGREAIVCSLKHLSDALSGVFGTHFFR